MPLYRRLAIFCPLLLSLWGLSAVARAAGVDDAIKAGVLKVCSPGDYKPFSFMQTDGRFEGLDVDLMDSLASSLGVKAEFVKATWAKMMDDFTAGKCDVFVTESAEALADLIART